MERVTELDETKLLGYFESIRGVFLTKMVFLVTSSGEADGNQCFAGIPKRAIDEVSSVFDDPIFFKALADSKSELHANFVDDMVTAVLSASWNIFEQVTKDLTVKDYATTTDELSVCYTNRKFQFDKREKKDIELFYYIRNAIHHYNGGYYAGKDIDHRYDGVDFKSAGHHGEKIPTSLKASFRMLADLEKYTIKAWQNAKAFDERVK